MNRRQGFTLVELVVVIMILGILAAVAAPKFFNTSATATENGLKTSLSVVRDAIELYSADHGGQFPASTGTKDEAQLKSDLATYIRGSFPKCPVGPKNDQVEIATGMGLISATAAATKAWKYNYDTGQFIVNSNTNTKGDATVQYDDL